MNKYCLLCDSDTIKNGPKTCLAWGEETNKTLNFFECTSCGFIFSPENTLNYKGGESFSEGGKDYGKISRVGTAHKKGREYHMAIMAMDLLKCVNIETKKILIYGAGMSLDHQWINKEFPGIQVSITDLDNFQNANNFIDGCNTDKFDIVVACEVLEHFTEPMKNLSDLLSKVSEYGIIVCSTNIRSSKLEDIRYTSYPFLPGHTSYYTGESLVKLARKIRPEVFVDFRTPYGAIGTLGSNKRYIFFTGSATTLQGVSLFFSANIFAPCEPSKKTLNPKKWPKRLARLVFSKLKIKKLSS